jgi:hypothetical protein
VEVKTLVLEPAFNHLLFFRQKSFKPSIDSPLPFSFCEDKPIKIEYISLIKRTERGGIMATVTVKVSDLTGNPIGEAELGARLIVEHPDFSEPIGLDVKSDEVSPYLSEEETRFVVLSYRSSEEADEVRYVLPLEEFESLFKKENSTTALQNALQTQQQERERQPRRGGRRQGEERRQRVDWASPERAGEPHRGTISEAEKAYVRVHLDEVNVRLRANTQREIDPNDPEMAQRYGLTP